ncbi:hypothetical protein BJY52DRAFT_1269341 [Lactarius psammicola]|nr:hypothetical protein BJY52DRAFT_1269341 [Lactarius psammicola]
MQTQLFSGTACFSPFVPPALLRSWDTHGGTVARTYHERRTAQYYFCSGAGDPWVARCVPSRSRVRGAHADH